MLVVAASGGVFWDRKVVPAVAGSSGVGKRSRNLYPRPNAGFPAGTNALRSAARAGWSGSIDGALTALGSLASSQRASMDNGADAKSSAGKDAATAFVTGLGPSPL